MSYTLDVLLDQAADGLETTVALSSISVAVALYSTGFLQKKRLWLDLDNDPEDQITDADWILIQDIVANFERELMTPEVGTIKPFITADPPQNTLECDGGTYYRVDFPLLYALLDSAFIIDADTFTVPDLRGRVVVGAGTGSGLTPYAVGDIGGTEAVALTVEEMPSHSHDDIGHVHTYQPPGATLLAVAPGELPVLTPALLPASTTVGYASLTNTGGDEAHENRPPFMALRWCVQCR